MTAVPSQSPIGGAPVPVLLAAGGAAWEPSVVAMVEAAAPRLALQRRCLDLVDLLATACAGLTGVAVVGSEMPGLDTDTVAALHRHGLTLVVVRERGEDRERLARMDVDHQLGAEALAELVDVVVSVGTAAPPAPAAKGAQGAPTGATGGWAPRRRSTGQVIAVWGATGAPGRTTVAVGLAAELAHRGHRALLLDADPYGGAVAQHLGLLNQVSGLLASARLGNSGRLDAVRLAGAACQVGERLRVLTGLPRADRWVEVRQRPFEDLLEMAAALDPYVVVDTGFCLEQDEDGTGLASGRNTTTLVTLRRADHIVVVGAADPVGLTRLVRALHDVSVVVPGRVPTAVVNRMRSTLGWSERDVASTVDAVLPGAEVCFLPEDRPAVDRALTAGRSLVECGDSALRRGLAALAGVLLRDRGAQALSSR